MLGVRELSLYRPGDGTGRARECEEERVALGVDLGAAMGGERLTDETAMVGEDVDVPLA